MPLHFSKMHGLGNDFVVIDAINQSFQLNSDKIRELADRHFGIGFDQLLLIEPARNKNTDFFYRVFNADGKEVAQCGNGARCLARFAYDKHLTQKRHIKVGTTAGIMALQLEEDGQVTVDFGIPLLNPKNIPFIADEEAVTYPLEVDGKTLSITAVGLGNPHCVLLIDNVKTALVQQLGEKITKHTQFPEKVNVGFMQVINRQHIALRVFERGVGETLACGSGAAAAVVAGILQKLLDQNVNVDLPGGRLSIRWEGRGKPLFLTGPATFVFEGILN